MRPRPNIRVTGRHLVHSRRPCQARGCRHRSLGSAGHSGCFVARRLTTYVLMNWFADASAQEGDPRAGQTDHMRFAEAARNAGAPGAAGPPFSRRPAAATHDWRTPFRGRRPRRCDVLQHQPRRFYPQLLHGFLWRLPGLHAENAGGFPFASSRVSTTSRRESASVRAAGNRVYGVPAAERETIGRGYRIER